MCKMSSPIIYSAMMCMQVFKPPFTPSSYSNVLFPHSFMPCFILYSHLRININKIILFVYSYMFNDMIRVHRCVRYDENGSY